MNNISYLYAPCNSRQVLFARFPDSQLDSTISGLNRSPTGRLNCITGRQEFNKKMSELRLNVESYAFGATRDGPGEKDSMTQVMDYEELSLIVVTCT
jgi:hypothetical protein